MEMNEYQKGALSTAMYPNKGNNIIYPTLGLVGEAGEVAEKVKKIIRDNNGELTNEKKKEIVLECSDVMWYIATLCYELGYDMSDVAQMNLDKLFSRKQRGKLGGSGDNR